VACVLDVHRTEGSVRMLLEGWLEYDYVWMLLEGWLG